MKRLHVHVSVDSIEQSVPFYAQLFGAAPSVLKADYAKWMLDDPRVNFAISAHADRSRGLNHLGIQAEDEAELAELRQRLHAAELPSIPEHNATCCYARSNKEWTRDPSGIVWEMFHSMGAATIYGENREAVAALPAAVAASAQQAAGKAACTSSGCC